MRRTLLFSLLISCSFVTGCGQAEYDNRLKQSISTAKKSAAAAAEQKANENDSDGNGEGVHADVEDESDVEDE